jgi:dienelactone hydrolase
VTAATIVSYYGPDPRLDTPFLIPKIMKPTMVVIAGNDEVVIGFSKKYEQSGKLKNVLLKSIAGADHFFRDLYADEAVAEIDAFLKGAGNY